MLMLASKGLGLRSFLLRHKKQIFRYLILSAVLALVGFALLYLLVSCLGTGKVVANLALAPVMGAVAYIANRVLVFSDRPKVTAESAPRWATYKLACFAASQLSFFILVGPFGVQYLGARMIIMAVLGPIVFVVGFVIANEWIFPKKGAAKA